LTLAARHSSLYHGAHWRRIARMDIWGACLSNSARISWSYIANHSSTSLTATEDTSFLIDTDGCSGWQQADDEWVIRQRRRVDDQWVNKRVIASDDDVELMSAIMCSGIHVLNKTVGCRQIQELVGPRVGLIETNVDITEDQQRRRKNRCWIFCCCF